MANMKFQQPLSIQCNYEGLDINTISTLVQSGIKLFLHQRNQIPLPLEQLIELARCSKNSSSSAIDESNVKTNSNAKFKIHKEPEADGESEEEIDPRERIQIMQSIRRSRVLKTKGKRVNERASRQEQEASNSITTALKDLDGLLTILPGVAAVCLVFGPIPAPKEVVLFKFQPKLANQTQSSTNDVIPIIRRFYKNIIMSEGFVDFTEKKLPPTKTHICVITEQEIEHGSVVCVSENLSWIRHLVDISPADPIKTRKCNMLSVKFSDLLLQTAHCYQLTTSIKGVSTRRR